MAMDERLKWMEARISSSLRPRNEELKNMFLNDENRLAFYEFINNEDVRRLFVFVRPPRQIIASLIPPHDIKYKSIFFLKSTAGTKLTKDNIGDEVFYIDCTNVPLEHLELVVREVYLPLMCTNQSVMTTSGGDKVMDVLHRLMSIVETTQGHVEGRIILSLPSIEVLAEAAGSQNRRGAVLHVLETTVLGWIKQIKGVLRHDPIEDIFQHFGSEPGPLDEIKMWERQLGRLHSILRQLESAVAKDILQNLEQAQSQYAHSFNHVRKDVNKAVKETNRILSFLSTMRWLLNELHTALEPKEMLRLFKPLMQVLFLVWSNSAYYHQMDKFHNILRLLSNEVVHRAIALVGEDILREPLESYTKLKEALRVCAGFRGTYLDFKDKADDQNAKNIAENAERLASKPQAGTIFLTKMYGPHSFTPRYGLRHGEGQSVEGSLSDDELWSDSPWPPRNAPCFDLLNSFMERCNDVLELVETTRHFRLLAGAAEIGGAGNMSLDALVKEIHEKYTHAMSEFFSVVENVLSIDGSQNFERAFFRFRTIVKSLEKRLAEILRLSYNQCPTVEAQLRLLEVFEGVSGRELVQVHLEDKDRALVSAFNQEITDVRQMYAEGHIDPPEHCNMPPIVSKLMWVHALKERIKRPMEKMRRVSPHSLEGDTGWQMRDNYNEVYRELEEYENIVTHDWKKNITAELTMRLKQPLLIAEEYDEDIEVRPQVVHVNLDPQLLLLLKETHYLSQEPFHINLPEGAKELLRNTNSFELRVTATRLEMIVSKYNTIMRTMTQFEKPLFERKLAKIDILFDQGLKEFTWKMKESVDFIEQAMALVCVDVHQNLDIVQTNSHDIAEITISWSKGTLDVFSARQPALSYSMEELLGMQARLNEEHESVVVPSGNKIHSLAISSFEAVQISQASPAWQDFIDYIDAIVLDGLKQATLTSLKQMLNNLVQANMAEDDDSIVPILTIRLELIDNKVAFRPPLDQTTSVISVQEVVNQWLDGFLARGRLVKMLGPKGTYQDYIAADEEVKQLLSDIIRLVDENSEECKKLLEIFGDYAFLWLQDVNKTFEEFLRGNLTPNPLRSPNRARIGSIRQPAAVDKVSRGSSRGTSASSSQSTGGMGTAERTFLTPKNTQTNLSANVPSLDEFDAEIEIYRTARDEVQSLEDYHNVGWLRVDLQPIKQVLTTYAAKWMWTFTKYLSDQVTHMLEKLDMFLKRIEPEIESITGEERDTASFMKMMRLFNEVSAQQSEMDGKFSAMNRTVQLLRHYGQTLPEKTQQLFNAAPSRWNSLKTKVSLAKQRLGPRIQEESVRITQDLEQFGRRVNHLNKELESSDVYNRECSIGDAWVTIDNFSRRLTVLENEAQDLIELQELLEASVVNFDILPSCRHELNNLKQVWETVRVIDEQQSEWKRHRWQKMNTKFLREETNKQLDIVRALSEDVFTWDTYMGLHESITNIQVCLPLIDDLSNPAMRTRHWKQLVRVTGGALTIDNDTLKRMTLGELLSLGLQQHVDDVRGIVQRAVKDLSIEQSLKTYEEVWLSKVFQFHLHIRSKLDTGDPNMPDTQSEVSQSDPGVDQSQAHPLRATRSQARTTSRVSNQSSHSKKKSSSVASLPASLLNLGEESGHVVLLMGTDPIFEELESHQVSLQAMQSNSAAGSFLDEVVKWQKRLQTIEAVLSTWLEVQEKWVELEEVYSGADVRTSLAHDANRFAVVNRDFRLLMRATEKNPNVLQCCSRKNILSIMEHMNHNLEQCRKSLLNHLERRRQIFPRFYFLSMEDVLHIVCNGYDLNQVNMYISKLFENVGSLVYEEAPKTEKFNFTIVGVQSELGEKLEFQQPVTCEGQIETWLTSFLQGLKAALQFQLATAMGTEKMPVKTRQIRSAGSRKVTLPARASSSTEKANKKEERSGSRLSKAGSIDSKGNPKNPSRAPSVTDQMFPDGGDDPKRSWTLDHVTEIVYLATQIQMTEQIEQALSDLEGGNSDALKGVLDKITESIRATTILLKGIEDEKEKDKESQTGKVKGEGDSEVVSDTNSYGGGIRSTNAPSLGASRKGSMFDVAGLDTTRSPIPEEDLSQREDNQSLIEPTTMEPVDTMNLADMVLPPVKKEATPQVQEETPVDTTDLRLMLFPSQIHKLSCLLALLAHMRDLVERLLVMESSKPLSSLDWRSQLQYRFNKENKGVSIKCLDVEFEYGFEYLGSSAREVITPLTERTFVSLIQSINSYLGSMCVGPIDCGKFEVVHELSRSFGHSLYKFNCTRSMDYCGLQDIFRGMASTGCWICFNNLNHLDPSVLSVFAQLITTVFEALRAGKAAVHLQSDDIQLNPSGACFALLDSSVPVMSTNPDKLLLYPSVTAVMPGYVMRQFRTISIPRPDMKLSLEVMLFSQGFVNGHELSVKTMTLFELCCRMLGTNVFITENISMGVDISAGHHGWSIRTLKGVVAEAGAHLEKLEAEITETDNSGSDEEEQTSEKQEEEGQEKDAGRMILEGYSSKKLRFEEQALVIAIRDTFLPRMQGRDASVFITLVTDVWPNADVPMVFRGDDDILEKLPDSQSRVSSKNSSRIRTAKSADSTKSVRESINLNTPVVNMTQGDRFGFVDPGQKQTLEDIHDAIAVATGDLGLLPGVAFQARVAQLAQLNSAHQTIFVVGPPGCGKSECIKTFAVAERERGKTISVQTVFSKAVESDELMGYMDPKSKEWKEGLFGSLLRKFCIQPSNSSYSTKTKPIMKIMQLDGEADAGQMELLQTVLINNGTVVMGNNERIAIPETLRFMWELESLATLSPALLANVGVLVMNMMDVGWQLMLVQWLEHRPETDKDLLTGFCDVYIYKTVNYLMECTLPHMFAKQKSNTPQFKRVINHTVENMVQTFTTLLDTMVNPYPDLSDVEFERYFNFACIWAFAGTLHVDHREMFSQWWRESFEQHIDYPEDGTVFDYSIDSETHEFCKWNDIIPAYSGTPHVGIPSDAYVHTVQAEQIMTLLGLLTDAGKSVVLIGENGCGKTAIVNDRIRTVCSGEVAEVLSLSIQANRFTNARLLYDRLDERLEWKHGRTYVPKGNKRLLCFVDDVNLSQVDQWGHQTAIELIREHIDDGGFYNEDTHAWRYVKNVTYVSTLNPKTTANVPSLSHRFLRHFAMFAVPYPTNQELQTIFTILTHTHFITPETAAGVHHSGQDEKAQLLLQQNEDKLKKLLAMIVQVTIELQERLRSLFLPTSERCHYIFTLRDLSCIFKNVCLSVQPRVSKKKLLLLWEHECFWVYGHRMVNEVDFKRFRQTFVVSIKKEFADDEQVQAIIRSRQPVFSNLIEQDSGIVTAGMIDTRHSTKVSEEDAKTDLYKPWYNVNDVKDLMVKGVEEYNKIHPRIKLSLYKVVVEQVCRLSRTIASPHENAHCVLVAEGCAGRTTVIVKLAAHLCGYTVYQINPSPLGATTDYKMEQFKADLVQGYTRAGAKGEKVLLLLHEEELLEEDFLVFLIEFITGGSISHLFQYEEQTTIINSIRTEVTQAGLTYTRDVAWNFFLKTVRNNFRVCLIAGEGGTNLQRRCREYPAFTKNVNFIWFPHWSKIQLVEHALYHLNEVPWMTDIHRENIAHMLASMHLVLRQQDGQERDSGEYRHVTNTAYEKFVERFISVASCRHNGINKDHEGVATSLQQIRRENEVAVKLRKNLEHEMVVLEERKAGTIKILSQIGQDTAITEQQIKVVKAQLDKISKLKKSLPEYQVAHERAVYKAIAIVADTKKVVQNTNIDKLHELRAMQKPIIDIEDLMAAIIMILKSPSADLTWQKGAKRQMANLERFIEELMSFDDNQLPENTLNLVEPYLKKPSFDPDTLERKTQNAACGSLCKWVRGVVRYHRMMISKVKPLHQKVDETTQAVDDAEHKMSTLENKRKALEVRLSGLAKGFEEATIDKNEQEEKTVKMKKMLETAAQLRKLLKGERQRCQQIYDSFERRLISLPGGCAMAAAFATYLGPYHHNFRRVMLTVHWPNCLRERGIPLVIDSLDGLKGRVIDWSIDFLKTASGASQVYEVDYTSALLEEGGKQPDKGVGEGLKEIAEEDEGQENEEHEGKEGEEKGNGEEKKDKEKGDGEEGEQTKKEAERAGEDEKDRESPIERPGGETSTGLDQLPEDSEAGDETHSQMTQSTAPMLSTSQYNKYIKSLVKLLVGEGVLNEWIREDFGPRQMENAAILCTSWQRPPMLIDPNSEGAKWLGHLNSVMNHRKLVSLDMETRTDPHVILTLEKAIMRGKPVLLRNCEENIDNIITPLMHHRNTANEDDRNEEPRMIRFCGRRILCHQDFRFYLSTPLPKPKFNSGIASATTIINFGVSHDTLTEDLLSRAFARIRPDLYKERVLALKNIELQKKTLQYLSVTVRDRLLTNQEAIMGSAKAVKFIMDFTNAKVELANRLQETVTLVEDLETLKDELYPLARRAAMLYAIIRSLQSIHNEYQFSLDYFVKLFDEAVGGELPEDFGHGLATEEGYEDDDSTSISGDKKPRAGSTSSHISRDDTGEKATDKQTTVTLQEGGHEADMDEDVSKAKGETDESASTAAAQRLVAGTESEELPSLELPQTASLPSEGVEYSSFQANQIKQLMDKLTGLIYRRIRESLFEEDCLLFATLMCLNIQAEGGENFTNEEMSLLLQGNPGLGMQLTLSDFDCKDDPPDWLPQEKWEDILALSVLPGPLDSLCVNFATNSDAWKSWYKGDYPEREPLPLSLTGAAASMETRPGSSESQKSDEKDASKSPDLGPLTDFHQLLLLRMLRPDRLPVGLSKYINKYLTLNLPEQIEFSLSDVLIDSKRHLGVLLLLPENLSQMKSHPVTRLKLTTPPVDVLFSLAKTVSVNIEHVRIGEGSEVLVEEAIDTAEKNEGWVVIEDLHLAPDKFFHQLKKQLIRVFRSREKLRASSQEEKQKQSKFCVWITSEPSKRIPDYLLLNLHKLAWNHVTMDVLQQDGVPESTAESTVDGGEAPLAVNYRSPQTYLHAAIVSTLKQVSPKVWENVLSESQPIRNIVFAVCVIQSMLAARQLFGTQGLNQYYPFTQVQTTQAINLVLSRMLRPADEEGGEPNKEKLIDLVSKVVYENAAYGEFDHTYVYALVRTVINNIYSDTSGTLVLGSVAVPTPPANVEPSEYAWWYDKNVDEEFTLAALQLHASVEKETCIATSTDFVKHMDHMFETQNLEAGDVARSSADAVNISRLRSALDICVEELPPLLELGQIPEFVQAEYDFPYHRPSVLSMATESSTMMPETIGYVLLQECLWMNSVLCHIRQQISELQDSMLGGPEALPRSHFKTVISLQEEHVPVSWVHPNYQPCTHSLVSWLEDMQRKYDQLQSWVKCGMVPTFEGGQFMEENPVISRGRLANVWLGGLVNPQALLTALRQEKAVVSKCHLSDVVFECVVLDTENTSDFDIDEGGMFISSVHIQNASWDYDNDCLADASSALFHLPNIYLKPVLESEFTEEEENRRKSLYPCPLFMNKSRQYKVSELFLNCPAPVDTWKLARTALILNPGLPEDGVKKSRSYLMNLRAPAMMMPEGESEGESEEADEELEELEPDESDNEEIGLSEPSQMSYRPISPKAPPLPPELALMMREMPMDSKKGEQRPRSKGSEGKVTPGARKTPTRKTPSKTPPKSTTPRKSPAGQRSPTLQAFKTDESKAEPKKKASGAQSPQDGRISRGSKGSKGRVSRGSRRTPVQEIDAEDENRPYSQAHEDPLTQVEIETDNTGNQNQNANVTEEPNETEEQNVTDQLNVVEEEIVTDEEEDVVTDREGRKEEEGPHYM